MSTLTARTSPIEVTLPKSASDRATANPSPPSRRSPYRAYRGTLLSPQRVRELSVLKPGRAVFDTAWCWLWILAAWTLVALYPTWWTVLLAIPVIGSRYYALFIIGHDGMHGRIFNSKAKSDLFTDLFLIGPIGAVVRLNAKNHLIHHKSLANDDDPDLPKHGCFNKTDHAEFVTFLTGVGGVFLTLRNVFLRPVALQPAVLANAPSVSGPTSAIPTSKSTTIAADDDAIESARAGYTLRDGAILLGWQAALGLGLTAAMGYGLGGRTPIDIFLAGFWAYPVLWLAPVYFFTYLTNLIRSFLEHAHPEDDDLADEHRLITFTSNPIERLLLAPMNMNYHIAHHLWPSIPYYNLPIADAEIRGKPASAGLTWRTSYFGYLFEYYRAQPLSACRESRHRRLFMGHRHTHSRADSQADR